MKKEEKKKVPRITHVMADGSVRDSVKGYLLPVDNEAYELLAKWIERKAEGQKQDRLRA